MRCGFRFHGLVAVAVLTASGWLGATSDVLAQGGMQRQGMMQGRGQGMGMMGGGQQPGGPGMMNGGQHGMMGQGMMNGGQQGMMGHGNMNPQMMARQRLMMGMQLDPMDPAVVMALKAQLGLTAEQAQSLEKILAEARQKTEALLNDDQKQQVQGLVTGQNAGKGKHGPAKNAAKPHPVREKHKPPVEEPAEDAAN